ncbi:MAG TPA: hypothetical protein VFV34_26390 [Blastocatellia bacterium]|nr:hypothetical protein [Blastocatellia bacterium]
MDSQAHFLSLTPNDDQGLLYEKGNGYEGASHPDRLYYRYRGKYYHKAQQLSLVMSALSDAGAGPDP